MVDLAVEVDTHQLERLVDKLDSYNPEQHKNFYVGMGREAKDEVPRISSKLKSILNVSKQINLVSGRINNTTRVVLSGDTLKSLAEILEELPNEDSIQSNTSEIFSFENKHKHSTTKILDDFSK